MKANFEKGVKICSKCRRELPISEYHKCKKESDGLDCYCKNCSKEKYLIKKKLGKIKKYSYDTPEKLERHRVACRKYAKTEKGYKNIIKNNARRVEYKKNWFLNKMKIDKDFNIRMKIRHSLSLGIKNGKFSSYLENIIGCDWKFFKKHIESKFKPGMTWDNYGKSSDSWQIDHIIPCSYFDLTKEENIFTCFNWRNTQPLWRKENYAKYNKVNEDVEKEVEKLKKLVYESKKH
jgi:hypothetical protein